MNSSKGRLRKLCSTSFYSEGKIEEENSFSSSNVTKQREWNSLDLATSQNQKQESKFKNIQQENILNFYTEENNLKFSGEEKEDDGPPKKVKVLKKKNMNIMEEEKKLSELSPKHSIESRKTASSDMESNELGLNDQENSSNTSNRNNVAKLKKVLDQKDQEIDLSPTKPEQTPKEPEKSAKNHKECSICLGEIQTVIAELDNCPHIFCFDCIKAWADVANICPLCKNQFKKIVRRSLDGLKMGENKIKNKTQTFEPPQNQEPNIDICYICEKGDDLPKLLVCDECEIYYCHTYCCTPPLRCVPAGNWYCAFCRPNQRYPEAEERKDRKARDNARDNETSVSRSIRRSLPENSTLMRFFEIADTEIDDPIFGGIQSNRRNNNNNNNTTERRESGQTRRKRRDSSDSSERPARTSRKKSTQRPNLKSKSGVRKKKTTDKSRERSRSRSKSHKRTSTGKKKTTQKKKDERSRSPKTKKGNKRT